MGKNVLEDTNKTTGAVAAAISDQVLRGIVEQGFFGATGSLADARAACAELIFARAMIRAQTAKIAQLDSCLMG